MFAAEFLIRNKEQCCHFEKFSKLIVLDNNILKACQQLITYFYSLKKKKKKCWQKSEAKL